MTRSIRFIGLATLGFALTATASAPAFAGEAGIRPVSGRGVLSGMKTGVTNRLRSLMPGPANAPRSDQPALGDLIGDQAPDWFRQPGPGGRATGLGEGERAVRGRLSATKERALADARLALDRAVTEWLVPDVPRTWKAPKSMVDGLIRRTHVEPIARGDLGVPELKEFRVVYLAGHAVDLSTGRRNQIIDAYHRDIVAKRLGLLGGGLGLVLITLSGLAGYIRADEATRGYYTNRLRLLSAAGVGAASVALYRWVF